MGHIVERLRGASDALRASFFFLPALAVLLAFPAARLAVGLEAPDWVGESTVDSARAVLSTVAAATITFASVTFSISLLIMQQASTQLSPRVIHGLTRDPFNRRVIAIVMGTFTFCLVALQRVRGPLDGEGAGEQVVPDAAVAIGLVLGVVAVLAVVAAIHHTARQMDVSVILGRIVDEALSTTPPAVVGTPIAVTEVPDGPPPGLEVTEVRFEGSGWIRSIERGALLSLAPPGGVLRLETEVGRYAITGSVLCRIWPALDADDEGECARLVNRAVLRGATRTMSQDRGYGVRQIVDVALRALSPGVNDPTTAQDAIFHLGTLLVASLEEDPLPPVMSGDGDRRLVAPHVSSDEELAELAFTELRAAASAQPTVALYLLQVIESVVESAEGCGAGHRTGPLEEQARLVVRHAETADLLDVDLGRLRAAHARRFVDDAT